MTPAPPDAPLTEADLDRLDAFLMSDVLSDDAMMLDELQGFLCAVISGPEATPASEWMSAAFGGDPNFESREQAQEFLDLLMRFNNETAAGLLEGRGVELVVDPDGEENDCTGWAAGYLRGVALAAASWESRGDAEEVADLVFPIMFLARELDREPKLAESLGLGPDEEQQLEKTCREGLMGTVQDIYDYWLERRTGRKPARPG